MGLKIGEMAPDFDLLAVTGEQQHRAKLSDFRGKKHVVLSFHPLDWTPTWAAQVPAFNSNLEKFAALNAQVLGISVDSIYSHIAWQKKDIGMMRFPLCADFYPHAEVSERYGIRRDGPPVAGISERAAFIVDKSGRVAFLKVYPLDQLPDVEELLRELEKLP